MAAAAAAAGPLLQGMGSVKQGQATQAADEYNAQIAEQNATFSDQEGHEAGRQLGSNIAQSIGHARAQYGASGIDSSQGSAMDVLQQSAANGARDLANLTHNYAVKSWSLRSGAAMDRFAGNTAEANSYFSASGSLAEGAGKYAGMKGGGPSGGGEGTSGTP